MRRVVNLTNHLPVVADDQEALVDGIHVTPHTDSDAPADHSKTSREAKPSPSPTTPPHHLRKRQRHRQRHQPNPLIDMVTRLVDAPRVDGGYAYRSVELFWDAQVLQLRRLRGGGGSQVASMRLLRRARERRRGAVRPCCAARG